MKKIKIAQWGGRHIVYMPLNIADRLGLFAAEGLQVETYYAGNDDDVFNDVAAGRADFGAGDPTLVALAHKKHDMRVVAAVVTRPAGWGITHQPEIKPFEQVSDFVSLRVGGFPKPATMTTMLEALKVRQPRLLKSMEIVETDIGQQAYLLAANKVDMILECEPMISIGVQRGLHVVCSLSDFFPEFLFTGLMTSQKLIDEAPDVVGKVVTAMQKALTLCRAEPEKIIAVAQELFPTIHADVMRQAVQRMLAIQAWPEYTIITPAAWNNALKIRQDVGELKEIPPFENVVDQRFAYAAAEKNELI